MGKLIKDRFTKLISKVSRQRLWQLRQKERGVCITCAKRLFTKNHCFEHAKALTIRAKKNNKRTRKHYKKVTLYEPYGPRV